jgi:signal transduction histidine kinase
MSGVVAIGRGVALAAVALAALVLLALIAGTLVLTGLGLGILLNARGGPDGARDLLGLLIGLASIRFVLPAALLGIRWLAVLTRRLSARWCALPIAAGYVPRPGAAHPGSGPGILRLSYQQRMTWLLGDTGTWQDMLWAAAGAITGPALLLTPAALAGVGVVAFLLPALAGVPGLRGVGGLVPPPAFPGNTPPVLAVIAVVFVAAGALAAPATLRVYCGAARRLLSPSEQTVLELRVAHLDRTRRETLDTGAAELRRIERDLHDGAQARLVSMGLTLDAAGRLIDTDPAAARALLLEARDASAKALAELRDLVRGVHPPVLADRGLAAAVRALALDTTVPVKITGGLPDDRRLPAPVESAAYFAVSELFANAAKHAHARSAEVDLRHEKGALRISVRDDGAGGADPKNGTGLNGIARRLAAFDGVLAIVSPVGGPTMITMEIPCELS